MSSSSTLALSDIAPVATTSTHVAAAAFYHCLGALPSTNPLSYADIIILVLATKDLIRVKQDEPYAEVSITIM